MPGPQIGAKEDSDDGFGDFDGGSPPAHGPSAQSLPTALPEDRPPSTLEHCLAESLSQKALSTELGPWGFLGGFKVSEDPSEFQMQLISETPPKHSEKCHIVALLSTALPHFQHHSAYLQCSKRSDKCEVPPAVQQPSWRKSLPTCLSGQQEAWQLHCNSSSASKRVFAAFWLKAPAGVG